ncbi:hypothetical protein NIES4072_34700 [Nostoc commune NIES-4072]|uniref:DUF928 domain-containing protein n=1 Tax=Nostoc commune NIES-4072 TaxID=2005467 RepID=A0A2R5FVD9_NOSCO|nr:DUF928 domain-containing protein [Nostoc commune]BBD69201.1 hypothetical protein NIES4070_56090 [Nostoc commune HK-02]GBG19801.1 hypothetical protein NIES4072_34700 [Nostoc commune NIES-4072]
MKLTCIMTLVLFGLVSYPIRVLAQVDQLFNQSLANTSSQSKRPKFPDNGAPTGRRKGGTSRDGCTPLNTPITALVPGEEIADESKSFLTFTISEYPTFWVFVPELPKNAVLGEFLLQDENDKNIYKTSLSLPQRASIVGIKLPHNSQSGLKINQKYQWYFKVFCGNSQQIPDYFYVKAWIQRVPLNSDLESQLKRTQSRKYTTYALNQIWQDALTNLATLRRSDPNSNLFTEDWTLLLKDVGLAEFATAPIVELESDEKAITQSN